MVSVQTATRGDLLLRFEGRLRRLNYSPNTIRDYLAISRAFLAAHPGVPPEMLSAEHVERFLGARPLAPRSYVTNAARLRAFFEHLRKHERLIRTNPCRDLEVPRWRPTRRHAPTAEEFERLRAACTTPDDALVVEVLYFTGLRVSELLALRWQDVDLERRRLEVLRGKGGTFRVVPFPPRVQALLVATRRAPAAPVVTSAWDARRPRAVRVVQDRLKTLGRAAGLRYVLTPHVLRHGFARMCKVAGLRTETIARLMGHADTRPVVAIYGWLDEDDLQREYDRYVTGAGQAPYLGA